MSANASDPLGLGWLNVGSIGGLRAGEIAFHRIAAMHSTADMIAAQNRAMTNALTQAPRPKYPRTDPKRPMSDKATHLLSLGGCLLEAP